MSQIFIETIARAISDYRFLLRRHLKQAERRQKLAELNLKDPTIFDSAEKLYNIAWNIVNDIEGSVEMPTGYYSYSGIVEFGKYLREYLESYFIENGRLVHSAQKASKVMIQAIQLMGLSEELFTADVADKLNRCNDIVVQYGSDEQKDMYETMLEQKLITHREFYTPIYDYFQQLLESGTSSTVVAIKEKIDERAVG